jgi:hypothetical protein
MELTISDDKMKIMITEVLSEMIQQKKRSVLWDVFRCTQRCRTRKCNY